MTPSPILPTKNKGLAPAASQHRSAGLRPESRAASQPSGRLPHGARNERLQHAQQDVKDRFHAQYQRLLSDMQAELDDLERKFWNGEEF